MEDRISIPVRDGAAEGDVGSARPGGSPESPREPPGNSDSPWALLARSDRRLQALFAAMRDVVMVIDREGRYREIAPTAGVELLVLPREELLGRTIHEILPKPEADRFQSHIEEALRTGRSFEVEYGLMLASGPAWFSGTVAPFEEDSVVWIARDMTARRRDELALRASEERYRHVVENQTEFIVRWLPDGTRTFVNEAYARFFGTSVAECTGTNFMPLVHPSRHGDIRKKIESLSPESPVQWDEHETFLPDGTVGWTEWVDRGNFDANGRLVDLLSVGRDLTERKRFGETLRESEDRFQGAFEHAAIGMALVAPDGRWLRVNESLCRIVGRTEEELLRLSFQDITHPEDLELDLDYVRRMLAGEIRAYRMEKRYLHANGRPVWILLSVSLVRDGRGAPLYFVSQIEDIDERKRAEVERERARYLLEERVKELTTLHSVTEILQSEEAAVPDQLRQIARLLPAGWQFPRSAVARIVFDGESYVSPGFVETPWVQRADFRTADGVAGSVEVDYLEEMPDDFEGPFLREERALIRTVAEMLRTHLGRRRAEEWSRRRFRHIAALHAIDAAIVSNLGMRATLEVVLGQIVERLGADAADILLLRRELNDFELGAARGFHAATVEFRGCRIDEGLAGRVAVERRLLRLPAIPDPALDPESSSHMLEEGFVSYHGAPLIAKGRLLGVLEAFHRAPFEPDDEWTSFFLALAHQAAIAVDGIELFEGLQRSNVEISLAYESTLEGWVKALDLRDKETEGHSLRVTEATVELGRAMGLDHASLAHLRRGALLHDVGKLGIPDRILLKPGPLDEEEWAVMRMHPVWAYEWLSPIPYLRPALDIPWCHHEKWDGTGYPRGLAGEEIPLAARMFAVVDVYDALTSDRPYRKGWTRERALAHVREQAGRHFDPEVVDAFLAMQSNR